METLMQGSHASAHFKADIERFISGGSAELVKVERYAPRVKVQRVLHKLLLAEAGLEIEEVVIRGSSGCSDFVGSVDVVTAQGAHVYDFVWCCRWRAETEGYVDYFGFPDQMRAAQEFGWNCFQRWERRSPN